MPELKETESGELVVIKEVDIPALFKKDGCDPIIEGLKKKAAEFEGDISTAKGRKAIASFAAKFSSAKTKMDGLGKALSDEYRAKIAPINEERNKIKACCDESKDKVRKPLTDWEDAEKERVQRHENAIQFINNHLDVEFEDSAHVAKVLGMVEGVVVDEVFEEFELAGRKAKENVVERLKAKFIVLQAEENEKAEAERLEKERLENEAENNRVDKIRDRITLIEGHIGLDFVNSEHIDRAIADIKKIIIDDSFEEFKPDAEKTKKSIIVQLEAKSVSIKKKEKKDQDKRDEQIKQDAIDEDKKKQDDQKIIDDKAEEKRQTNKKHRNNIHKEAKGSMMENGISEEDATIFVTMVKDGLVKNITINY